MSCKDCANLDSSPSLGCLEVSCPTLFCFPIGFDHASDYELALLDLIPKAGLEWKGNPNELNAAYAADGYARISNGIGALVTTYGPGELSALCGIAGAYCEYVPVLHIVGYPSVEIMKGHKIMHHSLGHGTFT